jgi:hypothetical protein
MQGTLIAASGLHCESLDAYIAWESTSSSILYVVDTHDAC